MTEQRRPLDWGLIGALTDIGAAVVLAVLLLAVTSPSADVVPRPVFLGVLFAVPGLIGLIGVRTSQAWLLVAGALPLIPGVFLSFTGVTLIFLLPAAFMLIGAARMQPAPRAHRIGRQIGIAALAIAGLIIFAGWAALFGMTVSACRVLPDGGTCGDRMMSGAGLIVALACLGAALAIAVFGGGVSRIRRRETHGTGDED
jgi:hypothetical protein